MSPDQACWGIFREATHSPGRVGDDGLILAQVADALAERGFRVGLRAADEIDDALREAAANFFVMCEGGDILDHLAVAEGQGAVVINSPHSIRNTYRHRTIELFAAHGVPAPASRVVATDPAATPPTGPAWIKRYDFHALDSRDVIYADSPEAWRDGLAGFSNRGIAFVVAQDHVAGDLVKFYGVGNTAPDRDWFAWFHPTDNEMDAHPPDAARLQRIACQAAAACGVEVFGGDAIIRTDGEPVIIDLNAWPSFARYRERAGAAIADYLADRFERRQLVAAR